MQKALAEMGHGSRRQVEQWIADGRVSVNGEPAQLGQRVEPGDAIALDGKPLSGHRPSTSRVLVLNKPEGLVCTRRDPEGRRTVFDGLPRLRQGRWIAVGRLDITTTGLLVLTNDGALAHRMMHPSTGLDREYAVRAYGRLDDVWMQRLIDGVVIDGERYAFTDVRYYDGSGRNHWYHVALMDGKNRAVRKLFERAGLRVSRLKRVRFGPVVLPATLSRGRFAELGHADLKALYSLLKLAPALPRHPPRRKDEVSMLISYPELGSL
ncbi:MAG: pseudouridine synthase [Gammaproteobacteria bacterium]|nr:pseudouridine synthase [Gammaproteobacteria bacterium]